MSDNKIIIDIDRKYGDTYCGHHTTGNGKYIGDFTEENIENYEDVKNHLRKVENWSAESMWLHDIHLLEWVVDGKRIVGFTNGIAGNGVVIFHTKGSI